MSVGCFVRIPSKRNDQITDRIAFLRTTTCKQRKIEYMCRSVSLVLHMMQRISSRYIYSITNFYSMYIDIITIFRQFQTLY